MPAAGPPAEGCRRRRPACPSSSTSKSRPAFRRAGRAGVQARVALPPRQRCPRSLPRAQTDSRAGRGSARHRHWPQPRPSGAPPGCAEPQPPSAAAVRAAAAPAPLMRGTNTPKERHRSRFPAEVCCPSSRSCRFSEGSPRHLASSSRVSAPPGKVFPVFPRCLLRCAVCPPCPPAASARAEAAPRRACSEGPAWCPQPSHLCEPAPGKGTCARLRRLLNEGSGASGLLLFRFPPGKRGEKYFCYT